MKGYLAAACILLFAVLFLLNAVTGFNLPLLPMYLLIIFLISGKLQGKYLLAVSAACAVLSAAGGLLNRTSLGLSEYVYYLSPDLAIPALMYLALARTRREKNERTKTEEALRAALEQTNIELENFTYIASHDLQEPLRMVSAYTELLERKYRNILDDNGLQYLNYAGEAARRMQVLIKDLLHYTRISSRDKLCEEVDPASIVSDVIESMRPLINESCASINYDYLPVIKADRVLLKILFQHLISNAIKFRGRKHPEITIESWEAENEWVFSVKDNGIGIAPEYYDKIFVIFQRLHTRDKFPGSGMGLSICRRIAEQHGGRIWVESAEGAGSIFYFSISKEQGSLRRQPFPIESLNTVSIKC